MLSMLRGNMRSPFPGMDPYLERYWSTARGSLIQAIAAALNDSLPDGLAARSEEEVRIETLAGERLSGIRPDVAVVTKPAAAGRTLTAAGTAVAEPTRIKYVETPIVDRRVKIVDLRDHEAVITAIEVLSPWNKLAGKPNRAYRRKQRTYESADVNWVEIDLLRSPRHRLAVTWDDVGAARRDALYLVTIYDAEEDGDALAYPISLRSRLPAVEIPLRAEEPKATLDLKTAIDRVYREGRFDAIDYTQPPDPPLSPDDAAWLATLLAKRPA